MKLKKIVKKIASNAINPAAVLGMNFQMAESARRTLNDIKEERQTEQQEKRAAAEQAVEAEKNDFLNQLDEKRRRGKKSNVIFAGLLGGSGAVGLGGRKSLLGL